MASSKRIGFFWGEEKITLVEFEKNAPLQVISSPLGSKANNPSPFSTNLTEEIQITAILQKMLQDKGITSNSFYVSVPMKEIILRSFVIPFVKPEDLHNAIKFEVKKYLPIDIQDLTFIFHTIPFTENKIKRLQVIFFAVRRETLARYDRIFKQVNATVSYCEPCMVSLTKVLLFKKEISPTDHLAFLILDKNVGRICFIDKGIPQFIREFSIGSPPPLEESMDSVEMLNLRIVNEVGNSIDFYARQFNGERMEKMLVSSEEMDQDLFRTLETELKVKLRKASPVVTLGPLNQANDMDTIYAMGACIEPSLASLAGFNFLEKKASKPQGDLTELLKSYKDVFFVFVICAISLFGLSVLFQAQSKIVQQQYNQLSSKLGSFLNVPVNSIQGDVDDNTNQLAAYKNIRTKSDVVLILLKVASHLPTGVLLKDLSVRYDQVDTGTPHITINMNGEVVGGDPNEQIVVVNQVFSDFKNDKELSRYVGKVNLVSLNRQDVNGTQATGFNIDCS